MHQSVSAGNFNRRYAQGRSQDSNRVNDSYSPPKNSNHWPNTLVDFVMVDKNMQKKLMDACIKGDIDVAERLIQLGADPNYSNPDGTLRPSIYYASRHGHYCLLRRLIERYRCNAHYKTPRGTTLLHLACLHGHEDIVKYLTSPSIGLDPSAKNKLGSTPLHLACVGGHSSVMQFLIENLHCDPQCQELEEAPLHTACIKGHLGILRYLIDVHHCNPFRPTNMKETPLHLAAQHGYIDIVRYLINEKGCDPMAQDVFQNTALHSAAQQNHPDIVRYLVLDVKCDVKVYNHDGYTPLHLACKYSRVGVVKVLLEEAKVPVNIKGPANQTPIQLAYNHEVVKLLIRHGANPREAQVNIFPEMPCYQLEDTIIRIMVVGDPSSGKTTLVEALKASSTAPKKFLGGLMTPSRVSPVEPFTAGIIPHEISRSAELGHVLIFDFAGHKEYYTSHSVVIENTSLSTGPIFAVVVDLSKEEEKVKLRLHYWIHFIENSRPSFVSKPHLVVVGSHVDVISKTPGKDLKLRNIERFSYEQTKNTSLHFAGFFAINCQKQTTQVELRRVLSRSCSSLRVHVQDDSLCHAFSVFLFAIFRGRVMCTVREVADVIQKSDSPFPIATDKLCRLCECLGGQVNIMFIRNKTNLEESTIVLDVNTLLGKIQGVMFAPQGFKEYRLDSKNGIVTFTKLQRVFSDLDPRVVSQCMQRLEFCQEVSDPTVLELIKGKSKWAESPLEPEKDGLESHPLSDEFYFFPCLIADERPEGIWKFDRERNFGYYTGWCLMCSQEMQQFTSRFLHTLLLRIAFNFAVVGQEQDGEISTRECHLWKNGIHWFDCRSGIESYVELREDSQVVVLVMRSHKGSEIDCIKLRAEIIQEILNTKSSFAAAIPTEEGLLGRAVHLSHYPLGSIKTCVVPMYDLHRLTKAFLEGYMSVFDKSQQNFIPLKDLLHWDPYMHLGEELLTELFDPGKQDKQISDDFIYSYSQKEKVAVNWEILGRVLDLDGSVIRNIRDQSRDRTDDITEKMLDFFRSSVDNTYGGLRKIMDPYSIFGGRNILELLRNY